MIKILIFSSLLAFSFAGKLAFAKEEAVTVRPTEVKEQPFSDTATVIKIGENSKVEVLNRKGSWMQIDTSGTKGWIKMLSVRFENRSPSSGKDNSELKSIFNLATTGNSGSTVTTAIRSLDAKKFDNTKANPQALEHMRTFAIDKTNAQEFAKLANLQSIELEYISSEGNEP